MLLNPLEEFRKMRTRSLSRTKQESAVSLTKKWLRIPGLGAHSRLLWRINHFVIQNLLYIFFISRNIVIYALAIKPFLKFFYVSPCKSDEEIWSLPCQNYDSSVFLSSSYFIRFFHKRLPKIKDVRSFHTRTHCITDNFFE